MQNNLEVIENEKKTKSLNELAHRRKEVSRVQQSDYQINMQNWNNKIMLDFQQN